MPGCLFDEPKYLLLRAVLFPPVPTLYQGGERGADLGGGLKLSGVASKRSIPMVRLAYLSQRVDNFVAP